MSIQNIVTIILLSAFFQGVFEWIPISSSGIVTALCTVLGVRFLESFNWSLALHLGSGIAAVLLFWKDFMRMLRGGRAGSLEGDVPSLRTYVLLIAISLIVGGCIYLYFTKMFHQEIPGRIALGVIGVFLIVTGILDYLYQNRRGAVLERRSIGFRDWIMLGVLQGLAVIPGLSRSGLILAYLSFRKVKPDTAFKISLIIGAPILILAGIGGLYFALKGLPLGYSLIGILISLAVSFVFGYLFYKAFERMRTWHFALTIGILLVITCLMSVLLG
ncbi:MAG: undecaprenyl-diphosphate phosphatase [Crenarchaeota archaeon]|nr:undecaprenyl-diphosphate phosphatase [Thermoproteota archaeon]